MVCTLTCVPLSSVAIVIVIKALMESSVSTHTVTSSVHILIIGPRIFILWRCLVVLSVCVFSIPDLVSSVRETGYCVCVCVCEEKRKNAHNIMKWFLDSFT